MTRSTEATPDMQTLQNSLSRRSLLAAALASGGALAVTAAAAEEKASGHDHHASDAAANHAGHSTGPAPHQALIDAALHCVNRGEVCQDHCIQLMSKGDTSLKDCIRSVSAMLPMCATLARLAALDAKRLKDFAKVCLDVCADCEAECKKHSEHHTQCKACADTCAACIKACKAVIGT